MDAGEFVDLVAQRADITHTRTRARPITDATLLTLAERLSGGEAADLAAELPEELRTPLLRDGEASERFGADEFCRRVAERAGVDADTALEGATVVFAVLHEAVSKGVWDHVTTQLPKEYVALFRLKV
ncbi:MULTISPECIES: DUF2267 domain-containing protein [unclassified Curtobacterium]|uniref:DUF2267 domain-containing protein n=1 Tax=unclassified Curtobacterium TaxID=257496 RepID=UPI000DA76AFD|nr:MULTISPECIES: DUF2267 domain-containing protein [unclassified Curtobacterium]PZE27372.1 DUF2267 domain-containing protein [Curtobacterium sp. MCBD17_028]PZF60450.1 DUF2267 domain-containing protein [Curtobacterium sp. MCBD17_034]PZM35140.1 DUF2267 domain-containing protein [Curtobacterium sp. MCBD17_031]